MIIEFQSQQQFSNHERFRDASVDYKSHAYRYINLYELNISHFQHIVRPSHYNILQSNRNLYKKQQYENMYKAVSPNQMSESFVIAPFHRKIYSEESDVR